MANYWNKYSQRDSCSHFLNAEELCQQSGLTPQNLERLKSVRLLVPDRANGHYRPKLASWAKKLAYLLEHGWNLMEIKAWAKGRWHTQDPSLWPPDRKRWQK